MEDILIDTDIAIEYLRSKKKGSTELVRLLRKHFKRIEKLKVWQW